MTTARLALASLLLAGCATAAPPSRAPIVASSTPDFAFAAPDHGACAAPTPDAAPPPTSIPIAVHDAVPPLELVLLPDDMWLDGIEVREARGGRLLQRIAPRDGEGARCQLPSADEPPVIADMNFDGYSDVAIQCGPLVRNVYYHHYLFDPKLGRFVPSEELDRIPNARFDPKARTIASYVSGGCCQHAGTFYAWRDGTLESVRIEDHDNLVEPSRVWILENRGGRLQLVRVRGVPSKP